MNCINALQKQDFDPNRYEIIVVDDGSTDDTPEILKSTGLTVVTHPTNKGISASRNSGLKAAKGDIYICFDDDCIAEEDWLSKLISAYDIEDAAGIAGTSIVPKKARLIDRFVNTYYMTPAPLIHGVSKNPIYRFLIYIKNMLRSESTGSDRVYEVFEIYGFSSSFWVDILKRVNGWDETLMASEDMELCKRIKSQYPTKKFYLSTAAKIVHDHRLNVFQFFMKPYNRGYPNLEYYLRDNVFPPVYPFPLLYVLFVGLSLYISVYAAVLCAFLSPQILYFWWIIKFFRFKNPDYLTYPYLQLGYESMVILGIIKGYYKVFTK